MNLMQNEAGKKMLKNLPFASDNASYDAALFADIYPVLAKSNVIVAVRNRFA